MTGSKVKESSQLAEQKFHYDMITDPDKLHKKDLGFIDMDKMLRRKGFIE